MKHHCILIPSRLVAALIALVWTAAAWSHPLPDLPVRSHFAKDGSAEIRIEVDPRGFTANPEALNYFQRTAIESLSPEKVKEMKDTADVFVAQRLRFFFDPIGEVKPKLTWEFKKLGDGGIPFETDDVGLLKGDETVLVGSWKTQVVAGMTGYRIEALPLTPEKMGAPLCVMFINFVGGQRVERYAVLYPGETSFTLDLTELGISSKPGQRTEGSVGVKATSGDWLSLFWSEIKRGFGHVVPTGMDHILFVVGVFLMTRKWKPLVLQISTFTVAHTITLWLASAGYVRLPRNIVDPLIAASIVVVALENVFFKNYTHWRLLIVFAFGLIHGLGFAGALATRLGSSASLVIGLLGVNIGVEFGQLAVIAVALITTLWIRDAKKYRQFVVIPGSLLIAVMGVWWMIERIKAR
jgi:hypothetical protein